MKNIYTPITISIYKKYYLYTTNNQHSSSKGSKQDRWDLSTVSSLECLELDCWDHSKVSSLKCS